MEFFLEIVLFVVKPAYICWRCAKYLTTRFGPDFSEADEEFIDSLGESPCVTQEVLELPISKRIA